MTLEGEIPASFFIDDSFDDPELEEEFEKEEAESEGSDPYDEFSED